MDIKHLHCNFDRRMDLEMYLHVERIVALLVEVAFPKPIWSICKWDQSTIHHAPTPTPSLARMLFYPSLGFFLFCCGWHTDCVIQKGWSQNCCYDPPSDQSDSAFAEPSPVGN